MEVGLFVGTEKPLNKSSSAAEFKAQEYYESCMDVNKTIEKLGAQPAKEFLSGIGSWPELNETKNFDIQSLVEKIKAYGIGVLFNYWVGVDDKNSTVNILQVCCILICRYLKLCKSNVAGQRFCPYSHHLVRRSSSHVKPPSYEHQTGVVDSNDLSIKRSREL